MVSRLSLPRALAPALFLLMAFAPQAVAQTVQRVVSPGGIEAWLIQDRQNPVISMAMGIAGGASVDPSGKAGLASMVSSTIDEGAAELDSQAFQGRLEDLSISLSFNAGRDYITGSLRTLTENRDEAFRLFRIALTEPRFDDEPVERIRRQILASLARRKDDPGTLSSRAFWASLYPDHPYGHPSDGTEKSIAAITKDDLRGYVARHFARDRLMIGVSGDITPEDLGVLLDTTFGALPERSAPIEVPTVEPVAKGALMIVKQDVPQSVATFGHTGISRQDPDWYAALVMNHVLGGSSFTSRLYEQVREKRGLAYSVYSYLLPMESSALIAGGVATQNSRMAESLELIKGEWARMRDTGPKDRELSDAKAYLTGSFPLRLTSTAQIAGLLLAMQRSRLELDYIEKRAGFIEAVTKEDVQRVARKLLKPDALTIVVSGAPEGLKATRNAPDGS